MTYTRTSSRPHEWIEPRGHSGRTDVYVIEGMDESRLERAIPIVRAMWRLARWVPLVVLVYAAWQAGRAFEIIGVGL